MEPAIGSCPRYAYFVRTYVTLYPCLGRAGELLYRVSNRKHVHQKTSVQSLTKGAPQDCELANSAKAGKISFRHLANKGLLRMFAEPSVPDADFYGGADVVCLPSLAVRPSGISDSLDQAHSVPVPCDDVVWFHVASVDGFHDASLFCLRA
jgi:hypothetical protein